MKIKSIILAAGRGSRLKRITKNLPKALIKINKKTLFQYQTEALIKNNIFDRNIVTGFKANKFSEYQYNKILNTKWKTTNMVYSLFCAEKILKESQNVLIHYGDIIFESKIVRKLINTKGDIVVVVDKSWKEIWKLRFNNPLDDAESLRMNKKGLITDIGKKEKNIKNIQGQYAGLILLRKKGIEEFLKFKKKYSNKKIPNLNKNFNNLYMTDLLQYLIDKKIKINAAIVNKGWLEVDSVNDLNLYKKLVKNNKLSNFFKSSV